MKRNTLTMLRDLQAAFSRLDRIHLVLGGELTDLALSHAGGRGRDTVPATEECDLVFAAVSWEEFESVVDGLVQSGLRRTARASELRHRLGAVVSLWPLGTEPSRADRLKWKDSGKEYSTAGLELALARALPAPLVPGLDVLVPSLPLLVLVRIVFYLGRMTTRDLRELVTILEGAPTGGGDITGARRLGGELRRGFPGPHLQTVRIFLSEIEAVHAPMISHVFRQRGGLDPSAGTCLEGTFQLFRELREGLGDS